MNTYNQKHLEGVDITSSSIKDENKSRNITKKYEEDNYEIRE